MAQLILRLTKKPLRVFLAVSFQLFIVLPGGLNLCENKTGQNIFGKPTSGTTSCPWRKVPKNFRPAFEAKVADSLVQTDEQNINYLFYNCIRWNELASLLGMSAPRLCDIISGKKTPTYNQARMISKKLDFNPTIIVLALG